MIDDAFALTGSLAEPHYIADPWRSRAALARAEGAPPEEIARCFDEARDLVEQFGLDHLGAAIERERAAPTAG